MPEEKREPGSLWDLSIEERLRLPCIHCGKPRSQHIGRAFVCFGGYGTCWHPQNPMEIGPRLEPPK